MWCAAAAWIVLGFDTSPWFMSSALKRNQGTARESGTKGKDDRCFGCSPHPHRAEPLPPSHVSYCIERQAIDIATGKLTPPSSPPAKARSAEDSTINGNGVGPTGYVSFPPSLPTTCSKGGEGKGGLPPPAPVGAGSGHGHSHDHGHGHDHGHSSHGHSHGHGAGESSVGMG